jgi:hypothetical protein
VNRHSITVMDIDASSEAPLEPMASRDTALACLARLGVRNGLDPTIATARRGDVLDGDTLPIARLVELAGEFEFQAEHFRVDWKGLLAIGFTDPILALLKNTNVVILTGDRGDLAGEVAVWDPLHRDGELLFVPRQEFERAWSGDVLKVRPQPSGATSPSPDVSELISEQLPGTGKQPLSQAGNSCRWSGASAPLPWGLRQRWASAWACSCSLARLPRTSCPQASGSARRPSGSLKPHRGPARSRGARRIERL